MKRIHHASGVRLAIASVLLCTTSGLAHAQANSAASAEASDGSANASASNDGIQEIIVTAQKRSQSLNDVPLSVTALRGETMAQRGIETVADLVKASPSFIYSPSGYNTPVYNIRGVGFYGTGFAETPAVAVYIDEAPVTFPVMQVGVGLDIERVEVLNGPQGTLFGGGTTGGAINYIAAKPTKDFESGGSITYARFNAVNMKGYVSGPISDTVKARLAVATDQGGAWQISQSRPGDRLGDKAFYQGRLLLDWNASDSLFFRLNLTGVYDHNEAQAGQLKYFPQSWLDPSIPEPLANYAGNSNVPKDFFTGPITPATTPRVVGKNIRLADWDPFWGNLRKNNTLLQASLRSEYSLNDRTTLTSLTSYGHMDIKSYVPNSGVSLPVFDIRQTGFLETFNQELRLSGSSDSLNWVLGGAYSHTKSFERVRYRLGGTLFSLEDFRGFDTLGLLPTSLANLYHLTFADNDLHQTITEKALFANAEYKLGGGLSFQGGLRFTNSRIKETICDYGTPGLDNFGGRNTNWEPFYESLQLLLGRSSVAPIPLGGCFTLDNTLTPAGPTSKRLTQDSLSWRFGVNYKFADGGIAYLSAARGYKTGVAGNIGASTTSQFDIIPQERLDAYEAGFKLPLAGRKVQLNAAAFYYDYKGKQVRGRVNDPVFGGLEKLIAVPKSRVMGLEGSIEVRPVSGLTTSLAATYLDSKVVGKFLTRSQAQIDGNYDGSRLPYTPKIVFSGDVQYDFALNDDYGAFVGASVLYRSRSNASFATRALPAPDFVIDDYATLDLRAGVGPNDERWKLSVFGRNVTNTYYINSIFYNVVNRYVYTGAPVTYGVTLAVKFH